MAMAFITWSCDQNSESVNSSSIQQLSIDVAQTSGQLASGASFNIRGGTNLLAPTDELLAIVDAESASDVRGLRVSKNGGATITNYDASGMK